MFRGSLQLVFVECSVAHSLVSARPTELCEKRCYSKGRAAGGRRKRGRTESTVASVLHISVLHISVFHMIRIYRSSIVSIGPDGLGSGGTHRGAQPRPSMRTLPPILFLNARLGGGTPAAAPGLSKKLSPEDVPQTGERGRHKIPGARRKKEEKEEKKRRKEEEECSFPRLVPKRLARRGGHACGRARPFQTRSPEEVPRT